MAKRLIVWDECPSPYSCASCRNRILEYLKLREIIKEFRVRITGGMNY